MLSGLHIWKSVDPAYMAKLNVNDQALISNWAISQIHVCTD